MSKKKEETEPKIEPEKRRILGSNNIVLPVRQRVIERLKELRETGKMEFWKDENGEWHDVEPNRPISGPLDYGSNVRKVNENEYHISYDLFATDENNRVVTVNIFTGNPRTGQYHKVVKERVTEVFKKGLPFTSKSRKLEDANKMRKDYEEKLAAWKAQKAADVL